MKRARIFRYGIAGLATLGVYLAAGQLLERLGFPLLWQACVSFLAAVCVNYLLQKTWVFEDRRPAGHSLPKYLVMIGAGAAINLAALSILSTRWPLLAAQLGAVVVVVCWNATLSFCWVFLSRLPALHASERV